MKKIALVTGGAGFIGSHMVDLLLKKNFTVRVIDNFVGGHKKNILQHNKNKRFKLKRIDICKLKSNDNFFKNVDYVFHFAGIGDIVPSIENPKNYMFTNVLGTVNVLEAARKNKVKKFVYAASASCYGLNTSKINENAKIKLEHPYALSKNLGEQAALHWHKVYKLPVNIIRIFNAYGPRSRTTGAYGAVFGVFFKQKLNKLPLTIIGDGNQSRDFVYVTDVVKGFFKAAESKISGEIFNLASGNPQKVNYLASLISNYKTYIPDRPGEPKRSWANINKIKKKLRWKPQVSFSVGVNNMIKKIADWKKAPLWTPKKIKKATKIWFEYLS